MRCDHQDEKHERYQNHCIGNEISRGEREMLRQHTTWKNTYTETQIPSGQVSGRGRTALGVSAKIDEQGIESRKAGAETQATAQSNDQKRHYGIVRPKSIEVMAHA